VASIPEEARHQFVAFRAAAKQIREASIISQGERIELRSAPGDPGFVDIFVCLLENERFRSLALAVRLCYLQREPAHFLRICSLLAQHASTEHSSKPAELRAQYLDALRETAGDVRVDDGLAPEVYRTNEVFDHWVNGLTFHQDTDRRVALQRLESTGARFAWSVQSTTLLLAGRILDLDDVVADCLGEERLPRI
jgi:hypothetical protein